MNIKIKALLQTAGILVVTSTIAVGIQLLFTTLTAKELTNLLAIGSITFLIYCMYQVVLSRLEYEQKVEEIAQK